MTPLPYEYFPYRSGNGGREWREALGRELRQSGLQPRVNVEAGGTPVPWMECLLWRNADRYCLALVKNEETQIDQGPFEIQVRLGIAAEGVKNLRTGRAFGNTAAFSDSFNPCEANLYSFTLPQK